MLEARKASFWRNRYEISADGEVLLTWEGSSWRHGGTFELAGQQYSVRGNMWGSRYGMVDQFGTRVASADRVGRKNWTVEAGGRAYTFHRRSIFRQEEQLHSEGQRLGTVKRSNRWRSDAVADLPGLPLPVQVFVLAVAITMWDSAAAAGATAAAAG